MQYKKEIKSGIYGIFYKDDYCLYIGQTNNFDARFASHLHMLQEKKHHNFKLNQFCNDIPIENLIFQPLFLTDKNLFYWEKIFIQIFSPLANNKIHDYKKLNLEYKQEFEDFLNLIPENLKNSWVSVDQLSKIFQVNLKKTGMILKYKKFKMKRIRSQGNKMYYYIE